MIKTKYNSKKIEYDGHTFDSKMECDFYKELEKWQQEGKIDLYELQPTYQLQEPFVKYGKRHRAITYTPDFKVLTREGEVILYDVKGFSSQQGDMRRKMFDYHYPNLTLKWITYVKKCGGWISVDEIKAIRRKNKREKDKQK